MVPEPLRRALKTVMEASDASSEAGKLALVLRPLLEAAIEEITSGTLSRPSKRGTGQISYIVERTEQGEVLTESRDAGQSKPFRCPKQVYSSLMTVFEKADRPLALEEIVVSIEGNTGIRPPDHQIRVALRLWTHVPPAMIARNRARYSPTDAGHFMAKAKILWETLKAAGFQESVNNLKE